MTYYFGKLRPETIRIDSAVGIPELATALTGTGLTLSNNPAGGFVIHRFRKGDKPRAWLPCDRPPGPRVA